MKKFHHYVYTLIIGILFINYFILFKNNREEKLQYKQCFENNKKFDYFSKFLKSNQKESIFNNGTALPRNLQLLNEDNRTIQLSDLIASNDNSPKLIIRFSADACDICLDEEMKTLNDFISKIGIENIMIFASNFNIRSLRVKQNNLSINLPFYCIEDTGIHFEKKYKSLYVFVVDKGFTVKDFFVPDKIYPDLSKDYYNTITNKYYGTTQ